MALYRLHKIEWEQTLRQSTEAWKAKNGIDSGRRKRADEEDDDEDGEGGENRNGKRRDDGKGQGRKGISSGLSIVVKHHGMKGGGLDVGKRGIVKNDNDAPRSRGAGAGTGDTSAGNWWEQVPS
jgi:RNA exonuclease 4